MARKRRTKTRKQRPLDPEDVLAGRVEIRPDALFDLIHLVNPTGRDLSGPEQARRYEQKGRLQSLLIRRFGDEHVGVEPTGQEDVVSLVHRCEHPLSVPLRGNRDACHTVVSELEADARSWVRRQLDLAAAPADREAGPRPGNARRHATADSKDDVSGLDVDELLRLARKALEDYDYERAEAHLTLAFDRGQGRSDTALALLDLWIGVLGMDQQALELEPDLAPAARTDPEVRTFLALAAARLGQTERALELVRGTALTRTAEVYAALADRSIRGHDREAASRYLEHVSRYEPTHPEIPRLTAEVEKLRVEDLRGPEAELRERYRNAGAFAVENEARAVASRWPESELARRILREVAAERRAAEIAEHLGTAERAFAEERFDDAARHFQAARDAGCERPDLPALIEEARDHERRRQEQARVDDAVRLFQADPADLRSALLGYLGLPEGLRPRLREEVREPALTWLDQLGTPRSAARTQAAVTAVLALGKAVRALENGEPRAALDLLEPHCELLQGVEEAGRCLRTAGSLWDAERRERGLRDLGAALEAWDTGRIHRAGELLEAIDPEDLSDADRTRLEELSASVRSAETVEQLEQEYERHLASEDYLGALDRARALAEKAPEPERWIERGEQAHRRVRAAWRFEVSREATPLAEVRDFWHNAAESEPRPWLDDEGRRLVLPDAWGRWLFLRLVDVESRTVLERVSLRVPEPFGHSLSVCWESDRIRIAGARGVVLELALRDWKVLGWHLVRDLLPPDVAVGSVALLPDSDFVWLEVDRIERRPGTEGKTCVVDLKAGRVSRRLPASWSDVTAVLGPEPRAVVSYPESRRRPPRSETLVRIFTPRGVEALELRTRGTVNAVAVAPGNRGLLLLVIVPTRRAEGVSEQGGQREDEGVVLFHVEEPAPAGSLESAALLESGSGFEIPGADAVAVHAVATALDEDLVFLLSSNWDHHRDLTAVATSPGSIEPLYRVPVPYATLLVQDRRSRRVAALLTDEPSPRVLVPGRAEPEPVSSTPAFEDEEVNMLPKANRAFCHGVDGQANAAVLLHVARLDRTSPDARQRYWRNFEADFRGDADARIELCFALRLAGVDEEKLREVIRLLAKDHPDHPGAALLMADLEAEDRRWEDVLERIRGIDPAALDDRRACHYHHLLGLALLHTNRLEAALASFESGSEYEQGRCPLESLAEVTRALADPLEADDWGADQPTVRQLVGAIRRADEALASGDARAARDALEIPAVWGADEPQSAARLAAAYLETESPTINERFSKRHALAFFCHVRRSEGLRYMKMFLPGMNWDEARLSELEEQARAWLGEPSFC